MSKKRSAQGGRPHGMVLKRRATEQLSDGTIGYEMLPGRKDDCFRASIATVLQVSPGEIPDPRLEARLLAGHDPAEIVRQSWAQLHGWLVSRGLRIVDHDTVPLPDARWIGVCPGHDPAAGVAALSELVSEWPRTGRRKAPPQWDPEMAAKRFAHFTDHCLVMSRSEILFDPAKGQAPPPDTVLRAWRADEVTRGFSVQPIQGEDLDG